MSGMFISVEGIDGSGKSSIAQALCEHLTQRGYDALLSKEPGGTATGVPIRHMLQQGVEDPYTEFLLFAADRATHMKQTVIPYVQDGYLVISDRALDSSRAYQGYGRGVALEFIDTVHGWIMGDYYPDVVLYLDLPPEKVSQRVVQRGQEETAFEAEKQAFFDRVHAGFQQALSDRSRVITIDATQPIDDVIEHAIEHILSVVSPKDDIKR